MRRCRPERPSAIGQRLCRAAGLFALLAALAGCSTYEPWLNAPLVAQPGAAPPIASAPDPTLIVAVTLSGGGARAAAFGYGVLTGMQRTRFSWNGRPTDLLAATDVITGVSGGSILAAYYAAFGAARLPDFERDFLRQDFQHSLIVETFRPANLFRMSSPFYGRGNVLAERLDQLYEGRTFGDLVRDAGHAQLIIAATDLSLGTSFEFTPEQFALICSDLRSVPLAFAVAASSAVPLVLAPMTLRNYAADCRAKGIVPQSRFSGGEGYRARMYRAQAKSYLDARRRPYIHLVDGGLADNLGVRRLLDRALAAGGLRQALTDIGLPAGSVRKLVLVSVNSERDPSQDIDARRETPGSLAVGDALLFGSGSRASIETEEFLADITREWRDDLKAHRADGSDAFAPDAEIHLISVNLRDAPEGLDRARLLQTPTAFSIGDAEVSRLVEAGRRTLAQSEAFQALRRALGAEQPGDD